MRGYSSQIERGYGNGHVDDLRVDDIIYDDTYGAMMFTRFPAEVQPFAVLVGTLKGGNGNGSSGSM